MDARPSTVGKGTGRAPEAPIPHASTPTNAPRRQPGGPRRRRSRIRIFSTVDPPAYRGGCRGSSLRVGGNKQRFKSLGKGRAYVERQRGLWPLECNARRVKRMPPEAFHCGPSVERVADQRMSDGGEVRTNLVAQRSRDGRLDQGPAPLAPKDPVGGGGRTRGVAHHVTRVDARVDAALIFRVLGDRELDHRRLREVRCVADELVALEDLSRFERGSQRIEDLARARSDDEA